MNEIPPNILKIVNDASSHVGRSAQERYKGSIITELREMDSTSPIEMAFLAAFYAATEVNEMEFCEPLSRTEFSPGIGIGKQTRIGKYKADFTVFYYDHKGNYSSVVVECDGTAFHERTESERRLEKLRDRFMQKQGMKVFRYTGKDILDNPYKVACEVIGFVSNSENTIIAPDEYLE